MVASRGLTVPSSALVEAAMRTRRSRGGAVGNRIGYYLHRNVGKDSTVMHETENDGWNVLVVFKTGLDFICSHKVWDYA